MRRQFVSQNNFSQLWQEIRYTLFFVISLLFIGILAGIVLPVFAKAQILQAVLEKFFNILSGADDWWVLASRIFLNNLFATTTLFISGCLVILPALILFGNGLIIGVFLHLSYNLEAIEPGNFIVTIVSLIPHGVFEMPALILSTVFGINLFLKLIFGKKILSRQSRKQAFIFYVKQFTALIVPLLILAALMEATVSDYLSDALSRKYQNKYSDSSLALKLDDSFLRKYNCHAIDYSLTNTETSYIQSPLLLGEALYDKEFLQRMRKITTLPHWSDIYQCESGYLKITAMPLGKYSVAQSLTDQKLILDKLKYSWEEIDNNIFLVKDDKGLNLEYLLIGEKNNKLMNAVWSGQNLELLQEIPVD